MGGKEKQRRGEGAGAHLGGGAGRAEAVSHLLQLPREPPPPSQLAAPLELKLPSNPTVTLA